MKVPAHRSKLSCEVGRRTRGVVLLAALLVLLPACGSAPGGSSGSCSDSKYLGHWEDHQTPSLGIYTIDINANCTAVDELCGAFTWAPEQVVEGSSVNVFITVTESKDPAQCLPVGEHHCSVSRSFYGLQERFSLSCVQSGDQYYRDYQRGNP